MDNDLEIFRRREERKKKKKKVQPESQVVFLAKDKNNEAAVFITDGEKVECISTPSNPLQEYNAYVLSDEFKEECTKLMKKYYPSTKEKDYLKYIMLFDPEGSLIEYDEYINRYVAQTEKG